MKENGLKAKREEIKFRENVRGEPQSVVTKRSLNLLATGLNVTNFDYKFKCISIETWVTPVYTRRDKGRQIYDSNFPRLANSNAHSTSNMHFSN